MDYTVMIAVYVSILIAFLFVMLFGPSRRFRDGPTGLVYWWLTEGLMERTGAGFRAICGDSMTTKMGNMLMCVTQTAHPMLQIFYVGLLGGGIYFFYRAGYPRIPNEYVPYYHLYIIPFIISCAIGTFLAASFSNPGIITEKNVEKVCAAYAYDRLLYAPKMCSTCGFVKPARSKHCSLCKACVARNCHHCPWVNNCIGAKNHRYFFNFLFCNLVLTGYGTWITFFLMRGVYDQSALPHLLTASMKGFRPPITMTQVAAYLLQREPYLGSLFLFLGLVTVVILAFFIYHLYLVARGTTTNETFKWDDIKDSVSDGRLFVSNALIVNDEIAETSAREKSDTKLKATKKRGKKKRSTTPETVSPNSGIAPTMIPVKKFSELTNLYNKGIIANFREIFFPPDF